VGRRIFKNLRRKEGQTLRIFHRKQLQFDVTPIAQMSLNVQCRDRMIPVLRSLQHIYTHPTLRQQTLDLVAQDVVGDVNPDRGRVGMTLWQVLVLAGVRQGCDFTYDHLQYLAENDCNLQALLQSGDWREESFDWRRIRDNLCLVRPDTIEAINHLVIAEGHRLQPGAAEAVRGDSFVVETNVHYPTESSLIVDGLQKILELAPSLAAISGVGGWRQSESLLKKSKKAARNIGRLKKGTNFQARLQAAYSGLFHITDVVLPRCEELLDAALGRLSGDDVTSGNDGVLLDGEALALYQELIYWQAVTEHVVNTAWRRVMEGETVPNADKLFSLFEPDTELIKRGKPAKPIQFGHKLLVIEDAMGFICHYKIVGIGVDERDLLVPEMRALQQRLQDRIRHASFDRGFHSPQNQEQLAEIVSHPCLPMPGRVQAARQEETATVEFRRSARWHSGIESAIGALQSGNGLKRCRDHSQIGYARYVGLSVLGRNLLVLGKLLLASEHPNCNAATSLRTDRHAA
jgi:IS5 family transposase